MATNTFPDGQAEPGAGLSRAHGRTADTKRSPSLTLEHAWSPGYNRITLDNVPVGTVGVLFLVPTAG